MVNNPCKIRRIVDEQFGCNMIPDSVRILVGSQNVSSPPTHPGDLKLNSLRTIGRLDAHVFGYSLPLPKWVLIDSRSLFLLLKCGLSVDQRR